VDILPASGSAPTGTTRAPIASLATTASYRPHVTALSVRVAAMSASTLL
jgi:hypothetical protein